ncbi:MAG: efflux RND transporter periplasmic adaptor subunit [Candidatus Velthaea sp.]
MRQTPVIATRAAALGAALLLGLTGCGAKKSNFTRPVAHVPVTTAVEGSVTPRSTLGGLIVAYQNVAIQSSLIEPAVRVNVSEGDHVRKGQVLAQLDTADLAAQLKSDLSTAASNKAKADEAYDQADLTIAQNANSINSAQAALRQAQTTLARDSVDLQRYVQLVRNGYISQQQYDQQATLVLNDRQAVSSAQVALQNQIKQVKTNGTTGSGLQGAAVAAARADAQTAIAQADQVRTSIAKATIVSPVDGVVVNRNLNPGEYPGTRQIFTLQETDRVYAVLNGSGSQIVGVATGTRATITASDLPGRRLVGTVVGVLDAVTPGNTNFIVKVLLPNPAGLLHAGMVVTGRVTKPTTRGIVIPSTAFLDETDATIQVVDESGAPPANAESAAKKPAGAEAEPRGIVKTVTVVKLADDGSNAVVTGLASGAKVVANGQLGLNEGQTVDAVETISKPKRVAEK